MEQWSEIRRRVLVVPTDWPRPFSGCPVCLTVYPNWDIFWKGGQANGYNFFELFRKSIPGDMISCYQEAEHLQWCTNGIQKGQPGANGKLLTPRMIQHIQTHMYKVAHQNGFHVGVGAIGFHRLHRGSPPAVAWMTSPLDWYGLDCYRTEFDEKQVLNALDAYQKFAHENGSGGSVCVPECNARDDKFRAQWFSTVANWVKSNNGSQYRAFFTFWGRRVPHRVALGPRPVMRRNKRFTTSLI